MDRVSGSGADLAEFAGGIAELLRALVMSHYGVEPEGLPESTRRLIATLAPRLAPEDAVRMLKLLGEAEAGIRRSANPRIGLETLLLRWAMMDRAADLRMMLAGAEPSVAAPQRPIPQSESPAPGGQSRDLNPDPGAQSPPRAQSEPKARSPEPPAAAAPSGLRAQGSGLSVESLAAAWSDVIATASRQSPMLGHALGHASPELVGDGIVELTFGPDSALFHDGVARQVATVETIMAAAFGVRVGVKLRASSVAPAEGGRKSKRLSAEEIREERLTQLRAKDPALDAAANALDLELVDDD